jgi:transcription elongation factor GreA
MPRKYLTKEGYKKLQEELDYLRTVKRKEVAERIRDAAENSMGEFIEDAEFEAAKNEQSFVEGRIKELNYLLANSRVVKKKKNENGIVEIGSIVTIKEGKMKPEQYSIVGAVEANPREGKISYESPLGKALMDHQEGDKVSVEAPSGSFLVRIVKVD